MASESYPRPGYNSGALSVVEHERLVHRQAPDGLFGVPTDPALVFADGTGTRQVKIRKERLALVRGTVYDSGSADIVMPQLPSNTSGSPRKDLIVLRLDRDTGYVVKEFALTGVPASNPVAPTPTANVGDVGTWDLPIAEVAVAHNAGALAAGTVTPRAWYVGSEGQILCTQTTRPPHEVGRRIVHTDLGGEYLISTGSAWVGVSPRVLFKPLQEAVFNATLQNDDNLSFAVEANSRYLVDGLLVSVPLGVNPGLRIAWSLPASATVTWAMPSLTPADAHDYTAKVAVTGGTPSLYLRRTSGAGSFAMPYHSMIVTGGTAGNATLQFAQATLDASPAGFTANSYARVLKVS